MRPTIGGGFVYFSYSFCVLRWALVPDHPDHHKELHGSRRNSKMGNYENTTGIVGPGSPSRLPFSVARPRGFRLFAAFCGGFVYFPYPRLALMAKT